MYSRHPAQRQKNCQVNYRATTRTLQTEKTYEQPLSDRKCNVQIPSDDRKDLQPILCQCDGLAKLRLELHWRTLSRQDQLRKLDRVLQTIEIYIGPMGINGKRLQCNFNNYLFILHYNQFAIMSTKCIPFLCPMTSWKYDILCKESNN